MILALIMSSPEKIWDKLSGIETTALLFGEKCSMPLQNYYNLPRLHDDLMKEW